jgi:hypothetical protein
VQDAQMGSPELGVVLANGEAHQSLELSFISCSALSGGESSSAAEINNASSGDLITRFRPSWM